MKKEGQDEGDDKEGDDKDDDDMDADKEEAFAFTTTTNGETSAESTTLKVWAVDGLAEGDLVKIVAENGTTETKAVLSIDSTDEANPKITFETGLLNTYPDDTTVRKVVEEKDEEEE